MKIYPNPYFYAYGSGLYSPYAGAGVGSLFTKIYRHVVPLVHTALSKTKKAWDSPIGQHLRKTAKRTALESGLQVLSDSLEGKSPAKSAKREISRAKSKMREALKSAVTGGKKKKTRGAKSHFVTLASIKAKKKGKKTKKGVKKGRKPKAKKLTKKKVKKTKTAKKLGKNVSKKGKKRQGKKGKMSKKGRSKKLTSFRKYYDLFD